MKTIVVGAGIGGLTATLALRRAGCEVVTLERSSHDRKRDDPLLGAGITLWPNGTAVLDELGARQFLPDVLVPLEEMNFRDSRGRLIFRDRQLAQFPEHFGFPSLPLHRADLVEALVSAVGAQTVSFSTPVVDFRQDDDSVRAVTGDGAEIEGDALIGADGISSAIRAKIVADGPPVYTGITSWRGVVPQRLEGMGPGSGGHSWGHGQGFGWVPIVDGRVYWYVSKSLPLEDVDGSGDQRLEKEELLRMFKRWHAPIPALLEATPVETILRNGLFFRPPVDSWGEGRVTLLGDAAHAMNPHLAQGAGQAIEDALVLGQSFAGHPDDPVGALRAYERARIPRANAFVERSNEMGAAMHVRNPLAARRHNRAMSKSFQQAGMKRHDRMIYGPAIPEPSGVR